MKRRVTRKDIAAAEPLKKRIVAALGAAGAHSDVFEFCMAMIHFSNHFQNRDILTEGKTTIRFEDGKLVLVLRSSAPEAAPIDVAKLDVPAVAERVFTMDAGFFDAVAEILRIWQINAPAAHDLTIWVLTAVGCLAAENRGGGKITSAMIHEWLRKNFSETDFDEGNIRKLARGIGIKLPMSAKESQKWLRE